MPALTCCASAEKVAERGAPMVTLERHGCTFYQNCLDTFELVKGGGGGSETPTDFFFRLKKQKTKTKKKHHHGHDRPLSWQTQQNKIHRGCRSSPPPPPPWRRACFLAYTIYYTFSILCHIVEYLVNCDHIAHYCLKCIRLFLDFEMLVLWKI